MTTTNKITIERAGIVEIYDALGEIKGAFDLVINRWTAAAMRQHFKAVIEPINEMRNDVDKTRPTKFLEERDQMVRAFALSDADGRPVVAQGQYVIDPARKDEFEQKNLALRDEHKEAIDAYEAEVKRVNEFLKTDIEVELPTMRLKLSWFNKTVKQETLEILFSLIEMDLTVPADDADKTADKKKSKAAKKD